MEPTEMQKAQGDEPESELESTMRSALPLVGVVLILLGIYLAVRIFLGIVGAIENPDAIGAILDRWEGTVEGEHSLVEFPATFRVGTVTAAPATKEEQSAAGGNLIADGAVRVNIARPLVIIALLILVGMLIRIAVSVIGAGTNMVTAMPTKRALKKIVDQLRRS